MKGVPLNTNEQECPLMWPRMFSTTHNCKLCNILPSIVTHWLQLLLLFNFNIIMPFLLDAAFLHVHKHVSMSIWVWPVFRLCVLLLCKSLLKRWVWGPLWSIRKKAQYESLFLKPKGCWMQRCCSKQAHHFKPLAPRLLWDGFLRKMPLSFHAGDYRVQAPVTLSMKDIFTKTYSSSTFVWKECKFLSI